MTTNHEIKDIQRTIQSAQRDINTALNARLAALRTIGDQLQQKVDNNILTMKAATKQLTEADEATALTIAVSTALSEAAANAAAATNRAQDTRARYLAISHSPNPREREADKDSVDLTWDRIRIQLDNTPDNGDALDYLTTVMSTRNKGTLAAVMAYAPDYFTQQRRHDTAPEAIENHLRVIIPDIGTADTIEQLATAHHEYVANTQQAILTDIETNPLNTAPTLDALDRYRAPVEPTK